LSAGPREPKFLIRRFSSQVSGGVVLPTPAVEKDVLMGEFNKDQGQGNQDDQQGGKPAFGQFDKTQGEQGEQGQQDQQELQDVGQKGEQLDEGRQQEQGEQFEKTDQFQKTDPQGDDQNR